MKKIKKSTSGFKEHMEKDIGCNAAGNRKYTSGEMSNPEKLKKSTEDLASYANKNKVKGYN